MAAYIRALLVSYLTAVALGSVANIAFLMTLIITRNSASKLSEIAKALSDLLGESIYIIILTAVASAFIVPVCSVGGLMIGGFKRELFVDICTFGGLFVGSALGLLLAAIAWQNPDPFVTYPVAVLVYGYAGMKSGQCFAVFSADLPNNSLQARRP